MIPEEATFLLSFPEVPSELRPRRLYVSTTVGKEISRTLEERGYHLSDVRLLPSSTDHDRAEIVKANLEGARVGSLDLSINQLKFLELEAKICGLMAQKEAPQEQPEDKLGEDVLESLLNFGPKKVFDDYAEPELEPEKINKNADRKRFLRGFVLQRKLGSLRKAGKYEAARILENADGDLRAIAGINK